MDTTTTAACCDCPSMLAVLLFSAQSQPLGMWNIVKKIIILKKADLLLQYLATYICGGINVTYQFNYTILFIPYRFLE